MHTICMNLQLSSSNWLKEVEMQLQESVSDMQLFEGDTFNMLVVYTDNHTKAYCLMRSY